MREVRRGRVAGGKQVEAGRARLGLVMEVDLVREARPVARLR